MGGKGKVWQFILGATVLIGMVWPAYALEMFFVHTSDIHAHYECFNASYENTGFEEGLGGSARMATFIEQTRALYPNTVVVDTGDQFNKSPYFNRFGVQLVRINLQALRYDMVTLGNHEFVLGAKGIKGLAKDLGIPVLCANVDYRGNTDLPQYIQPYVIKEIDGEDVGFIAAVVGPRKDRSRPLEIDSFEPRSFIEAAVKDLTAKGVNKIILLSHCGIKNDLEFAEEIDGIDVILGGHSHVLFSNTEPAADFNAYPMVINNGRQNVLVAHSGYYGKYAGFLQVVFDENGYPAAWRGDSVFMDESVKPSRRVEAVFQPYKAILEAEAGEVVGYTAVALDGDEMVVRFGESALANFIADAMLDFGKRHNAEIAIFNSGSIAGGLARGDITNGGVTGVLPYNNLMVVADIAGADLRSALEHGLGKIDDPLADGTGRFLQVAGLRYSADLSRPAGQRLLQVDYLSPQGYTALDDERIYKVITYDFMAHGGDGNLAFKNGVKELSLLEAKVVDVVVEYLKLHSPIKPRLEGRVNILNRP